MQNLTAQLTTLLVLCSGLVLGCGDKHGHCDDGHVDPECPGPDGGTSFAQTLFVAHEGSLVSYDIATKQEKPGALQDISGPVDLQALDDGTLLVAVRVSS